MKVSKEIKELIYINCFLSVSGLISFYYFPATEAIIWTEGHITWRASKISYLKSTMESDISMSEASRLIVRARQLGREYMGKYACAEGTLLAVADTLNMPVSDDVFKATTGLSSMSGGCGALCGAIAALGLRFGRTRAAYENSGITQIGDWYRTLRQAVKRVRDRFVTEYGGYLCCDIQDKLFGRSYDSLDPVELEAMMQVQLRGLEVCRQVTENAAGWTVEAILETEAASG